MRTVVLLTPEEVDAAAKHSASTSPQWSGRRATFQKSGRRTNGLGRRSTKNRRRSQSSVHGDVVISGSPDASWHSKVGHRALRLCCVRSAEGP